MTLLYVVDLFFLSLVGGSGSGGGFSVVAAAGAGCSVGTEDAKREGEEVDVITVDGSTGSIE